ncbi:MAG: hypothetical protein J3Q66DRAFT_115299 [Benniella sp.]|nr:MAG: hypothetical protein J3Q66DRAFT_115299 [Benniella sp.]
MWCNGREWTGQRILSSLYETIQSIMQLLQGSGSYLCHARSLLKQRSNVLTVHHALEMAIQYQTSCSSLASFQRLVELNEAYQIYQSLARSTAPNLESKSQSLKSTLKRLRGGSTIPGMILTFRATLSRGINTSSQRSTKRICICISDSNPSSYQGYH